MSKDVLKILEILNEWNSYEQINDVLRIDSLMLKKTLQQLVRLGFIHTEPLTKDDGNKFTTRWEPVDLALQRQRNYGGGYPMSCRLGKSPSPLKQVKGLSTVTLRKIHNSDTRNNHSLLNTLDNRKSIREYSSYPMHLDDLSHFLYSSARVKKVYKSDQGSLTKRPYPSGGGRYPLELYIMNNKIAGIQKVSVSL